MCRCITKVISHNAPYSSNLNPITYRPAPNITWKILRGGKWEQLGKEEDNFKIADAFHGRLLEISFVNQSTHQTQYRCEASNSQSSGNPLVHKVDLKVEGNWPKGEGKSLRHVALVAMVSGSQQTVVLLL